MEAVDSVMVEDQEIEAVVEVDSVMEVEDSVTEAEESVMMEVED